MGDQTLCSAFSAGGKYFATGGTDHVLRVYVCIPGPPLLQAELKGHKVGGGNLVCHQASECLLVLFGMQWITLLLSLSPSPVGSYHVHTVWQYWGSVSQSTVHHISSIRICAFLLTHSLLQVPCGAQLFKKHKNPLVSSGTLSFVLQNSFFLVSKL